MSFVVAVVNCFSDGFVHCQWSWTDLLYGCLSRLPGGLRARAWELNLGDWSLQRRYYC